MDVSPTGDEGRMGGVAACARSACDVEATHMHGRNASQGAWRSSVDSKVMAEI
jgi:hypothetical protein